MSEQPIILRPSSAAGWVRCAGKPRLEALYPEDTDSDAAREGTAAHWALSEMLNGRAVAEGQITPDNFVLTAEMVEAAQDVIRWIHLRIAEHGGEQPRMFVEHFVKIARVHAQCQGTFDLCLYFSGAKVLYVLDYKFGFGRVEVFENWQLLCYLAGVLEMLGISGADNDALQVVLGIIQPRSFHPDGAIRLWRTTPTQARPYIVELAAAALRALAPDATCTVNDTCDHCDARHACPALQAQGLRAADRSKQAVPFDLPPHALGLELKMVRDALKALTARETGLTGQAEAILKGGGRVPFWAIESKPGNMAWKVTGEEVITLGKLLGVDLQKPVAPITPTQARDRGIDPALLEVYAERPAGKPKLVPMTDASARKVFGP